jgi:cysteine desulfurase
MPSPQPPRIYADYNATAPLRLEAREAMLRALEGVGNASSVHAEGRRARAIVEAARDQVSNAIGACRDDLAFVSGGTEAVAAPIRGALARLGGLSSFLASGIEHDAVATIVNELAQAGRPYGDALEVIAKNPNDRDALARLQRTGNADAPACAPLHTWPVGAEGRVDLDFLRAAMDGARKMGVKPLVSLMLVNNETGVIQPVAEAAEIVHAAGGLIHCDAIQGLGKIEVSVIELDLDYLSLSAHKIGGPQGVGAFYVKPGAPFAAVQTGGGQEFGRRAGTENVAGLAAFGAAADAAVRDLARYQALSGPRDNMEARLKRAAHGLAVHGQAAPRVAGVSCFGVEGLPSETQIMGLDLAEIAVSAGSACSSGKVKPSRVLTAMGLGDTAARSAIRASFGWASQPSDFEALADVWLKMAARARPQLVSANV